MLSNSNLWALYIGHDLDAKKKASRHLFPRQTDIVMMAFASPEFQMDELMQGIWPVLSTKQRWFLFVFLLVNMGLDS